MREIKYRQPLKIGGFHYWGYVHERGVFVGPLGENDASGSSEAYTGLKDKNGKDIYGGDICRVHIFTQELGENMGVVEGEHEFIAEIKLENISAGVMLENSNGDSGSIWGYGGMHEESFEIIGDIHTTPELILNKETKHE